MRHKVEMKNSMWTAPLDIENLKFRLWTYGILEA